LPLLVLAVALVALAVWQLPRGISMSPWESR